MVDKLWIMYDELIYFKILYMLKIINYLTLSMTLDPYLKLKPEIHDPLILSYQ